MFENKQYYLKKNLIAINGVPNILFLLLHVKYSLRNGLNFFIKLNKYNAMFEKKQYYLRKKSNRY